MTCPVRLAALLPAVLAVACSAASDRAAEGVVVTDSAGITITLSPDAGVPYATVAAEPAVSLGGPTAEGPAQFFQIDRVVLTVDRLWAAAGQSAELRVFDADGAHSRTVGGRGDGPGEYLLMRLLGEFSGDTVAVADQRAGRLAVYGPDGTLVRSDRLRTGDGLPPRPFDVYPDGSVLGQVPQRLTAGGLQEGAVIRDGVRLARFRLDADPVVVAEDSAAGPMWLWTGTDRMTPLPFTANAAFDLSGTSLHLAAGPAFRVRVFEEGRLTRIYGVDRVARQVTASDAAVYRDEVVPAYPEARHAALLEAMDHPAAPSLLPAYTGLLVADDGTVWAGRHSPDTAWDVFADDGVLLGGVEVPPRFRPMSIRGGRVAGVWRDELGVEYVQVYAMEREAP
jgi:hypothetical protein